MKLYQGIRGTQKSVAQIEVNVDTVYVRSNIKRIVEDDFTGWEYDEIQYNKNEYIEKLTSEEDATMLAMMASLLMLEVDMIKSMIGGN